ncbi:MAG TPA: hypothetical protein VNA16_04360 [Abditibacteriaceae bacterium]|nr:hypothetical protein [Abditibacteriaceae bacterium]
MSSEETPSERVVPDPTPVPVPVTPAGEAVAENYVADQLRSARAGLQQTRIIAILLMVFVVGYLSYVTIRFQQSLRPEAAAQIANGIIIQQVEDKGPELAEQTKQRVLALIAGLPDYAKEQLPQYRTALEHQIETDLERHCKATSELLGDHLDQFLEENQDKIKEILTTSQDKEAVQQLGDDLEQQLMEYLKEKPSGGESMQEQIDKSLRALHEVEGTVRRLANAKNLTPQERKTRRAIALIAKSAEAELKDFEIKEISFDKLPINLPTTGENSEETAGGTTGGASGGVTGNTAGGTTGGATGNTAGGRTGAPSGGTTGGATEKSGQGTAAGAANAATPGTAGE